MRNLHVQRLWWLSYFYFCGRNYNLVGFFYVWGLLHPHVVLSSSLTRSPSPEPPPPHLGNKICPLSRVLVTIGNYKNTLISRAISGNLPENTAKYAPFPKNMGTDPHAIPLCIRGEAGFPVIVLTYFQSLILSNDPFARTVCVSAMVTSTRISDLTGGCSFGPMHWQNQKSPVYIADIRCLTSLWGNHWNFTLS